MNIEVSYRRTTRMQEFFRQTFGRQLDQDELMRAINGCLDAMSRDRLEDMGIAPRTDANRRTSGEAGAVPRAMVW